MIVGFSALARGEDWAQFRGPDFGRASHVNNAETWPTEGADWRTRGPGRGAPSRLVFGDLGWKLNDYCWVSEFTPWDVDCHNPIIVGPTNLPAAGADIDDDSMAY